MVDAISNKLRISGKKFASDYITVLIPKFLLIKLNGFSTLLSLTTLRNPLLPTLKYAPNDIKTTRKSTAFQKSLA